MIPNNDAIPHVALFKGTGFLSWLIRSQEWGDYTHAALVLSNGETIIEAWPGAGVRYRLIKDWQGIDLYRVEGLRAQQWTKALVFAGAQTGCPYDWLGDVRFVAWIRALFTFLGFPKRDKGKWFCSELVMRALEHSGVKLLEWVEYWKVSPEMLATSPLLKPVSVRHSRFAKAKTEDLKTEDRRL